jgi:predicted MPP superfamily phosphohydrolase
MLAVLRTPFMLLPFWWGVAFELLGTFLVVYGFYLEPFLLDVHHETLLTDKIPPGTTLKIAHLGDLHIERLTRREKDILRQLEKASPDLILFSGDILNLSYVYDPTAQQDAVKFLNSLHAPLGVYGVTGSLPVDPPEVYRGMTEGTPLRWLDDQIETLKSGETQIAITALTCSHHPDEDFEKLEKIGLPDLKSGTINVLLYHSPDIAPLVQQVGYDLQLSGHTHGGQVRLPFYGAIFAASLYHKTFEAGRYLLGKMTLYVTRGLGMEGGIAPRVRFLCRPELILWEIKGI